MVISELKAHLFLPTASPITDPEASATASLYAEALEKGLIGSFRGVVAACRASGQRRQQLQQTIQEGNEKGYWKGKLPEQCMPLQ